MLNFDDLEFFYEPFPIGRARNVVAPDIYREMLASFPPVELFNHYLKLKDDKFYLNEVKTRAKYLDWIDRHPVWKEFHRWIKSEAFPHYIFGVLNRHHIELGIPRKRPGLYREVRQVASDIRYGRYPRFWRKPYVRFEFSAMKADGGYIRPHTDAPDKIVTLVLSMVGEGEWKTEWGGGLEVDRVAERRMIFNHVNHFVDFSDVEPVRTFEFVPNQCVVFVKTHNSYHCVRPLRNSGSTLLRKTLTINIEYE